MNKKDYIDFVRFSLDDSITLPNSAKRINWTEMMIWAKRQAIIGIVYQGIEKAGKDLSLPLDILATWISYAYQIKAQNQIALERYGELNKIIEGQGFRCCLLKGIGVASYYPKPLLRNCGDLDVWVDGGIKEIIHFVRRYDTSCNISLHHVDMNIFHDQPVEIHFIPGYLTIPYRNKRLQLWFDSMKDEQFSNSRLLIGKTEMKVCVPTTSFILVYLMVHMYRHFLYEGIGLRHVIDYYYVMLEATKEEKKCAGTEIENVGLSKFCSGIMWIMCEVFGVKEECLFMNANEKEGKYVLNRINDIGNFGMNRHTYGKNKKKLYNFRIQTHYKEEMLWSLLHSIIYRIKTFEMYIKQ